MFYIRFIQLSAFILKRNIHNIANCDKFTLQESETLELILCIQNQYKEEVIL